ncbi:hypothetical protein [Streptomyces sp. AS58]|nr:hypothetical protein [Streptomyces sp. AS58]
MSSLKVWVGGRAPTSVRRHSSALAPVPGEVDGRDPPTATPGGNGIAAA